MEVQFWSTPIHNKIVYQFDNNVLKIKGLKNSDPQIIHFNGHYYLQNEKRVYQIVPAADFRRLVEVRDISFK